MLARYSGTMAAYTAHQPFLQGNPSGRQAAMSAVAVYDMLKIAAPTFWRPVRESKAKPKKCIGCRTTAKSTSVSGTFITAAASMPCSSLQACTPSLRAGTAGATVQSHACATPQLPEVRAHQLACSCCVSGPGTGAARILSRPSLYLQVPCCHTSGTVMPIAFAIISSGSSPRVHSPCLQKHKTLVMPPSLDAKMQNAADSCIADRIFSVIWCRDCCVRCNT